MRALQHSQITVLAIDDERTVLELIARKLEAAGYVCLSAHDADSAADMLRRGAPDLIIADINLSGHSGLTICEHLREDAHLVDVPVMYLSATQVPDIVRRTHATGGTSYYLRKPFDAAVLLKLIEQVVAAPQLAAM